MARCIAMLCAVGKIPVDFDALGPDTMALTGHKFGGPQGIGINYSFAREHQMLNFWR